MLVAGGIIGSAATAQFQINGNAEEIADVSESVDDLEDIVDGLRLEQKVDLQEIRGDVKMILQMVESLRRP
jgi:hypothetical protein